MEVTSGQAFTLTNSSDGADNLRPREKTSPLARVGGAQTSSLNTRRPAASLETVCTMHVDALEAEEQQGDNRGRAGVGAGPRTCGEGGSTGRQEEEVWGAASGRAASSLHWQGAELTGLTKEAIC